MAERNMEVVKLDQFPNNSHKSKEKKKEEEVRLEKIVKTQVRQKKKSAGSRVKDAVISEDGREVANHLVGDILIPALKDTIINLVSDGINMLLWGDTKGGTSSHSRRDRDRTRVSYESYYDRSSRYERPGRYSRRSSVHDLDDVIFESRDEAEDVLEAMLNVLDEYDFVTVGNFNDLVGIRTNPTDFKWGWDNLARSHVDRVRDGYIIRFPQTIVLD